MLHRSLSFGIILALAVVVIISMGVGYGAWTSTLVIGGTLQTASFKTTFTKVSTVHSPDFGECIATIKSTDDQIPILEFAIMTAYPGFHCSITFEIKNNGSIPITLQKAFYSSDESDKTSKFSWGTNKPVCGEVLAPGNSLTYNFTYLIPLTANPPQNATFKNSLNFNMIQFNGYDALVCSVTP